MDNNQLQTALGVAIAAEDYVLASRYVCGTQVDVVVLRSAMLSPTGHGDAYSIVVIAAPARPAESPRR